MKCSPYTHSGPCTLGPTSFSRPYFKNCNLTRLSACRKHEEKSNLKQSPLILAKLRMKDRRYANAGTCTLGPTSFSRTYFKNCNLTRLSACRKHEEKSNLKQSPLILA